MAITRDTPVEPPRPQPPAPPRRARARQTLIALVLLLLFAWAWRATQVDLGRLFRDAGKAQGILGDLLSPSLLTRGDETQEAYSRLIVPCADGVGPEEAPTEGPQIQLSNSCLNAEDEVTVVGSGFRPNTDGRLYWQPSQGVGRLRDKRFTTDGEGNFSVKTEIPALLADKGGESSVQALVTWPSGRLRPSPALNTAVRKMIETIFLALMATTLGAIIAIPVSFFGARNLMPRTPLGNAVYTLTRTFFNITRAIEPLILATIFAIWVGFGPFAGVLALSVSTIANIGKLYAEAAENIDAGPMEAIRATGANDLQTILYAVIPQIVPPYLSFTIYYWDINVRMSTIIGFVGGGGIGRELYNWTNTLQWNSAATAVWLIVVVVILMDYFSAIVREKLT